jgi:hypothetical protein
VEFAVVDSDPGGVIVDADSVIAPVPHGACPLGIDLIDRVAAVD